MTGGIRWLNAAARDDLWEGTARYELTQFMADVGCRAIVRGETFLDLEVAAMVERIKAETARTAEKLVEQAADESGPQA